MVGLSAVAVVLTLTVWLALLRLLRLPFSPGFSAFTFPMVIGASAQFKLAQHLAGQAGYDGVVSARLVETLARFELYVATAIVAYVCWRYLQFYCRPRFA